VAFLLSLSVATTDFP